MSLDSTMISGGAEKNGGASIKHGGELESPFEGASKPSTSGSRGMSAPFSEPSDATLPLKLYEDVSASPASLESTLESNITRQQ